MTKKRKQKLVMQGRILLLLLIMTIGLSESVVSQMTSKFEHYSYFNSGLRQSFTLTSRKSLTDKWGFSTMVTVKSTMGGGMVGLDYKVNSWLLTGMMAGYDIQMNSVVLIPYVVMKKDKVLFSATYLRIGEVLDLFELALMVEEKNIKYGVIARNYFGVGPRVDLRIPKTPVFLWAAGLYEWKKENYGLMAGLIIPLSATASVK